ncbi:MAG: DNA helicase RecQ [Bacteroidia bacterium]|nr:DNA helicase RecQ [Bacteroidia bacterium]MCF8425740.1 DNA helicase RecQ [Bacteroidia bacterium]
MQATINPQNLLKKHFGYDSFRPLQEEIINHVLNQKDSLVLIPTGGGKSVCFQLPALLLPNTTIVISPLIALMKDQVEALKANGISAAFLNSSMSDQEQAEVLESAYKNEIKLLYLSPEKLLGSIQSFAAQIKVSQIAIDEAHCISQWGHDFRPEYTKLKALKEYWPEVPIIALTATADKITRKDIVKQLGLFEPKIFLASFDRPNLSLTVRFGIKKKKKIEEIVGFIHARNNESGIIYCLSRKSTEEMALSLKDYGISAGYYHAGMSNEDRTKAQDDFINDRIKVVCATIAFGMGIDKSNVRFVIHNNLPKNMEGYYQEIGRAGRDGLPSDTVLYYSLGDLVMLRSFIDDSGQKELSHEKLNRIQQYAETPICRRKILLAYFGETLETPCNNCDVCKHPRKNFDGTLLAQKALSAMIRTDEKVGLNVLVDILRGSHRKEIIEGGFDKIKTFGIGKDISFHDWQQYLMQMLNLGLLEIAYDENYICKVTEFGKEVLYGKKTIAMVKLEDIAHFDATQKATSEEKSEEDLTASLFDYLRNIRRNFAEKENVPAYVIFSDATLKELATKKPIQLSDLFAINGMGEFKIKKYGPTFTKEIKQWLKSNDVKVSKVDTYLETLKLLKNKYSIEEIATSRNLHETTIYSHIAQLYSRGDYEDISSFFTATDLHQVKMASEATGEKKLLGPIFQHLKEEIPYHVIRLCLAFLAKQND